jgi:hypothetical protein
LAFAVCVQVDETRRDDQASAVNDLRCAGDLKRADADDALALDRQVALDAGLAGAVVQRGTADDDVSLHGGVTGQQREQREGQGGQHKKGSLSRIPPQQNTASPRRQQGPPLLAPWARKTHMVTD